jgi:hypothetical protein
MYGGQHKGDEHVMLMFILYMPYLVHSLDWLPHSLAALARSPAVCHVVDSSLGAVQLPSRKAQCCQSTHLIHPRAVAVVFFLFFKDGQGCRGSVTVDYGVLDGCTRRAMSNAVFLIPCDILRCIARLSGCCAVQ